MISLSPMNNIQISDDLSYSLNNRINLILEELTESILEQILEQIINQPEQYSKDILNQCEIQIDKLNKLYIDLKKTLQEQEATINKLNYMAKELNQVNTNNDSSTEQRTTAKQDSIIQQPASTDDGFALLDMWYSCVRWFRNIYPKIKVRR